jgi:hypothetical protein
VAQLGARLDGIEEVGGSNPPGSTIVKRARPGDTGKVGGSNPPGSTIVKRARPGDTGKVGGSNPPGSTNEKRVYPGHAGKVAGPNAPGPAKLSLCPSTFTSCKANQQAGTMLGILSIWKSAFDIISRTTPNRSRIEAHGSYGTSRSFQLEVTR